MTTSWCWRLPTLPRPPFDLIGTISQHDHRLAFLVMKGDVERALESCAPPIREVALRTCNAVLAIFPDVVVTVENQNPRFGTTIGFGTSVGYKGLRFTVTPQRTHVTLGIAHGADLPDPSGLMEGTGKVHRHVKLRQLQDLDRPELRQLMAAAMVHGC